jgi:hypothetical protein
VRETPPVLDQRRQLSWREREMPSFFILDGRVVRFIASRAAEHPAGFAEDAEDVLLFSVGAGGARVQRSGLGRQRPIPPL